jgi:hypothetical protein
MAEGLAERSVDSYERILVKWATYTGDKELGKITREGITTYLSWLRSAVYPAALQYLLVMLSFNNFHTVFKID